MTIRSLFVFALVAALAACHRGQVDAVPRPELGGALATVGTPQQVDSLWARGREFFNHGKWQRAQESFERMIAVAQPGDERLPQAHFFLAECYFATNSHLQAVREFRRVSDETPDASIASEALLRAGDAYADLWRRPELDPTYGHTALATYQELLNRYPGTSAAQRAQARIQDLQNRFAYKQYRAGLFYFRLKAYDSAILYFRDLVATYPRAAIVPETLVRLVKAYQILGYKEDVNETCGYIRRYYPQAPGADELCPAGEPVAADTTKR